MILIVFSCNNLKRFLTEPSCMRLKFYNISLELKTKNNIYTCCFSIMNIYILKNLKESETSFLLEKLIKFNHTSSLLFFDNLTDKEA